MKLSTLLFWWWMYKREGVRNAPESTNPIRHHRWARAEDWSERFDPENSTNPIRKSRWDREGP